MIGGDAVRSADPILVAPALTAEDGGPMSAYAAFFRAGARADLPASYTGVWVVLRDALRLGAEDGSVTVRAGDSVHVPERTPGVVESLEDTGLVCVPVPAHRGAAAAGPHGSWTIVPWW